MHQSISSFSREIARFFDRYFEEFGLATSYVELLILINDEGPLPQKVLCDRLNLAPSTITRFIQKLEKKKLVEKYREGKSVSVILSSRGTKLAPILKQKYAEAGKNLKKIMGDKFVETTDQLLQHGITLIKEQ